MEPPDVIVNCRFKRYQATPEDPFPQANRLREAFMGQVVDVLDVDEVS
jgi:hypothetical protein